MGDIVAQRVAIEEGAYFKGKVDIQKDMSAKDVSKSDAVKSEAPKAAPVVSAPAGASSAAAGGSSSVTAKTTPGDGK